MIASPPTSVRRVWFAPAALVQLGASAVPLACAVSRCVGAFPASARPLSLPLLHARGCSRSGGAASLASSSLAQAPRLATMALSVVRFLSNLRRLGGEVNSTCFSCSLAVEQRRAFELRRVQFNRRANPAVKRTRNGKPRMAFISFWAMRGPPLRAA